MEAFANIVCSASKQDISAQACTWPNERELIPRPYTFELDYCSILYHGEIYHKFMFLEKCSGTFVKHCAQMTVRLGGLCSKCHYNVLKAHRRLHMVW